MSLVRKYSLLGVDAGLDAKAITQRQFLVYMGTLMSMGGLVWGSICFFFGLVGPAMIPYGYVVATIINFTAFYFLKNFTIARFVQVGISLALPLAFQAMLGGFAASGAVALWALISLVASITFQSVRNAVIWGIIFIGGIITLGIFDHFLQNDLLPPEIQVLLFTINIAMISAIVVALILYFVISRDDAVAQIEKAKRESETLLGAVTQGLFLIDKDFKIKNEYSQALVEILDYDNIAGREFIELMNELFETDKTTLQNFCQLLFKKKLSAKKINMVNPLDEITRQLNNETQVLSFNFVPILNDQNGVEEIFAILTDNTEKIKFETQIAQAEAAGQKRVELISIILKSRPEMVKNFTAESIEELAHLKAFLRHTDQHSDHKEVLETLYRRVHMVKGNAALLKLSSVADMAHDIEESISKLNNQANITGSDYLPVLENIVKIEQAITDIAGILDEFTRFNATKDTDLEENFKQSILELAAEVSAQYKKKVEVQFSGDLPLQKAGLTFVKTIIVQLVRNAIFHGIEMPSLREQVNKPVVATIRIMAETSAEGLVLTISDDGAGINLARVKEKAQLPDTASKADVIKALFQSGFSTAEEADINAGRGVGLDLIKSEISQRKGKISVFTKENEGTRFVVQVPLVA